MKKWVRCSCLSYDWSYLHRIVTLYYRLLIVDDVLLLQEHRVHQLEEKMRMLQASKDELQAHATIQSGCVSDLQSKNANLTLENEGLRRKIEDLNQVWMGFGHLNALL